MRRMAFAVCSLALLPAPLCAQTAQSELRSGTAGGVHLGAPAIVSLAIGGYHNLTRNPVQERSQDVFALVEPGVNAGRISVGYGDTSGNLGTGWTIRYTLLRTWRRETANYMGTEFSGMALGFGARLGLFERMQAGHAILRVTADLSFGL